MDLQQLASEFLASEQGTLATQALSAQGLSPEDAQQALNHVAEAAHGHVETQSNSGLLGEHAGKSFFASFASGLIRGDGFFNSLMEGGEGILTGRVAESLAAKMGIDPSTASTIAAAATPYVVAYLKEKLA